MILKYFY